MCLATLTVQAQDTIRQKDGDYKVGHLSKSKHPKGWWSVYNAAGKLQEKRLYKRDRRVAKAIRYQYNQEGELIIVEPHQFWSIHGTVRYVKTGKKVKYRYGYYDHQLKNRKGQRYVYYFTYGLPYDRGGMKEESDVYACRLKFIAGCVVNNRIQRVAAVHNFFVNLRQISRFGFHWQRKYFGD